MLLSPVFGTGGSAWSEGKGWHYLALCVVAGCVMRREKEMAKQLAQ